MHLLFFFFFLLNFLVTVAWFGVCFYVSRIMTCIIDDLRIFIIFLVNFRGRLSVVLASMGTRFSIFIKFLKFVSRLLHPILIIQKKKIV